MKPRSCLSCAMAGQPCLRERALSIRNVVRILERRRLSGRGNTDLARPVVTFPLTRPILTRRDEGEAAGQSEAVAGMNFSSLNPIFRSSCWKRGSPRRRS